MKMLVLMILFLEIAQVLSILFLCGCFLFIQVILYKKQVNWKKQIIEWKSSSIYITLGIVEILTLLVVLPFCEWWFSSWQVSSVDFIKSIVFFLSILLFVGKVGIIHRELKKLKQIEPSKEEGQHPYL